MALSPFVFSSDNLPRLKAKQLSKTFPFLKLSAAQEATARALGFPSWYECVHRGIEGQPSPSDQDAGLPVRVARYSHQAGVLMSLGITPMEADRWVRAWGLTGHPTLAQEEGVPLYYVWNKFLQEFESGAIDEQRMLEEFGEAEYSKYPEIDRPERICPGVILGPMGKYPHYAVDPATAKQIPIYLRGPSSTFHIEDGSDVLAMCIPGWPSRSRIKNIPPRLNRIHHEWHYGQKHPGEKELCVPKLIAAALERPEELVVISQRWMPTPGGGYDHNLYAIACLRGKDFAGFLKNKGVIDPSSVIWFRNIQALPNLMAMSDWLAGFGSMTGVPTLPVFEGATKLKPSLPLYSYPFMTAPMSSDEYSGGIEHPCLLPLEEDYDGEDDDGSDDGNQ